MAIALYMPVDCCPVFATCELKVTAGAESKLALNESPDALDNDAVLVIKAAFEVVSEVDMPKPDAMKSPKPCPVKVAEAGMIPCPALLPAGRLALSVVGSSRTLELLFDRLAAYVGDPYHRKVLLTDEEVEVEFR